MAKKMAQNESTKGIIELRQEELSAIQEQLDENVRQYNKCWEERNVYLESGQVLKAKELEGKYYHLRDVVAKQLDRKRIEIVKEIDELQAEAFKLKNVTFSNLRNLERQKDELEVQKKENQRKLEDKEQAISNTYAILQADEQRLLELEGE